MTKEEVIKLIESIGFACEFKNDTCNIIGAGIIPPDTLTIIRQYYTVVINTNCIFNKLKSGSY